MRQLSGFRIDSLSVKPLTNLRQSLITSLRPERATRGIQLESVLGRSHWMATVSLLAVGTLTMILWPHVPPGLLLAWSLTLVILIAIGLWLARRVIANYSVNEEHSVRILLALIAAIALTWGTCGVFLNYTPAITGFGIMATVALLAGLAIFHLGHYLPAYLVYLFCSTAPVFAILLVNLHAHPVTGVLVYLSLLAVAVATAYGFNRFTSERPRVPDVGVHRQASSPMGPEHDAAAGHDRKLDEVTLGRARFRDFTEIATDFYWEADRDMNLTFTSTRGHILNGVPMAELISSRDGRLSGGGVAIDDHWRESLMLRDAGKAYELEATFISDDGRESRIHIKARPFKDDAGSFAGYRGVARDISREHQLRQEFSYQANHDSLTGQFNRRRFLQCVDEFVEDARTSSRTHLFCYIDLDRFKLVNDSSGHIAGDALLVETSNEIAKHLRADDVLGRIGGDEFGILLKNCSTTRGETLGNRIIRGIQELDFDWDGRHHSISASIGISVIDDTAIDAIGVLIDADKACYRAKELGAGRTFLSNRTGADKPNSRSFRFTDWMDAFDRSLIQLYAQPIIPIDGDPDGSANWHELLIRLVDRHGEEHAPEGFVPYAERFGQIARVDEWVVAKSFEQIPSRKTSTNHRFSINLSGASLHSEKLRKDIFSRFGDGDVKPESICFEITETSAIRNLDIARKFIEKLRAEGCLVALDDFGTGLASFSYLKHFPVDFVKIDGSFIKDLEQDSRNPIFVESICSVARAMNIRTIGECVESRAVIETLSGIGVDFVQGRAIGAPTPLANL